MKKLMTLKSQQKERSSRRAVLTPECGNVDADFRADFQTSLSALNSKQQK